MGHILHFNATNPADIKQDAKIAKLQTQVTGLAAAVKRVQATSGISPNPLARQTLAQRLKARGFGIGKGKIEFGPIEIGKAGIGTNAGFMRGAGGRAFTVGIIGQAVGGAFNSLLDGLDRAKAIKDKGGSNVEIAKAGGLGVAGGVRNFLGSMSGFDRIMVGILRTRGMSEADATRMSEQHYEKMFTTREELARRDQAKREAVAKAHADIAAAVGAAWQKLDHTLPETFRLSGTSELKRFRQELREVNRPLIQARADALRNQASRNAEGN